MGSQFLVRGSIVDSWVEKASEGARVILQVAPQGSRGNLMIVEAAACSCRIEGFCRIFERTFATAIRSLPLGDRPKAEQSEPPSSNFRVEQSVLFSWKNPRNSHLLDSNGSLPP